MSAHYFKVVGNVQGVMFRQTLIRGAYKRGLKAGATNLVDGSVSFTLIGDIQMIDEIISFFKSRKPINSWKAKVDELFELSEQDGIVFEKHEVTTENVDTFNWSEGVEMYL